MSRNRRQQLARRLCEHTSLTYQQALAALDRYSEATGRLPRTAAELTALSTTTTSNPATSGAPAIGERALRSVGEVTSTLAFTLRHSDLARCPVLSMSVAHYLPSGDCAHVEPVCPTCAGAGALVDGDGDVVTCETGHGLPAGVPVCGGSGVWSGARAS